MEEFSSDREAKLFWELVPTDVRDGRNSNMETAAKILHDEYCRMTSDQRAATLEKLNAGMTWWTELKNGENQTVSWKLSRPPFYVDTICPEK